MLCAACGLRRCWLWLAGTRVTTSSIPHAETCARCQARKPSAWQVRNKAYFEELKAIGADELIDTSSEDVVKRVKEITGAPLDGA